MSLEGDPEARATGQIDPILVNDVKVAAFSVIDDPEKLANPSSTRKPTTSRIRLGRTEGQLPDGDSYELRIAELLGLAHRTSSGTAGAVRS